MLNGTFPGTDSCTGFRDSESGFKRPDRRTDLSQIIIELMIAAGQPVDASLRNRARIQIGVRGRRGFVLEPMVEMDGDASRKPRAKVARQLQILARPPAFADKGCRNEEDRPELPLRWLLRESADQNRRADRMTDENRVIVQTREFPLDRRLPCGVAWVVFVRHSRIADLVLRPQLAPKALDKLVIPFVMDPRTASLNEEHLAPYAHVTLPHLRGIGLDFNMPVNRFCSAIRRTAARCTGSCRS
jgi:hypothetical protein